MSNIFNAKKFYEDYRINYSDSGSKHTRPGWINVNCPFCGGRDYHLGFHIKTGAVNCWKCGTKGQIDLIKALLGCDYATAKDIQETYADRNRASRTSQGEETYRDPRTVCEMPPGTTSLSERAREYLRTGRKRKDGSSAPPYDPDLLEKVWGLKSVGPAGRYKWRIIAPITIKGRMVSYQGRDITGLAELRYKACKQEDEIIDHQKTVYGLDQAKGDSCLVVEGIADVWRLGPGAVCCFGTAFTLSQVNLLAERYKYVYIMFDSDDDNAVKMAYRLGNLLSARGVEVEILTLEEGDPGDMNQKEADDLMRELYLEGYSKYRRVA